MSIRLSHPIPEGTLTDRYGWRSAIPGVVAAQLHTGQDWAAPAGTPIRAMHAGRVTRTWWDRMISGAPAGGNMLELGSARVTSRYAHLSRYAVTPGDEVRAGQIIGYVGRTGAATGDHLHAELLIGGQFVDPMPYLRASLALTNQTPTPPRRIRRRLAHRKDDHMIFIYLHHGAGPGKHKFAIFRLGVKGTWWEFTGQESANKLADQHGNAMPVNENVWNERKKAHS